MRKLIVILAIVACAVMAQAQSTTYEREMDRLNSDRGAADYWPVHRYNDPPPPQIQWNLQPPEYHPNYYDIRTGHTITPPPYVIQSRDWNRP